MARRDNLGLIVNLSLKIGVKGFLSPHIWAGFHPDSECSVVKEDWGRGPDSIQGSRGYLLGLYPA